MSSTVMHDMFCLCCGALVLGGDKEFFDHLYICPKAMVIRLDFNDFEEKSNYFGE